LVVSKDDVVGVQLDNFLQANNNNVSVIPVELKQKGDVLLGWVHHVAVPCHDVYAKLFMGAVI
jgi:hypothetical protein